MKAVVIARIVASKGSIKRLETLQNAVYSELPTNNSRHTEKEAPKAQIKEKIFNSCSLETN